MDIKIGLDSIDNFMIGTEQIDKVYVGSDIYWEAVTLIPDDPLVNDNFSNFEDDSEGISYD